MCAFHPNAQLRLLEQGFDPASMLRQSLTKETPWSSIVEFATSEEFCGQVLYPRQQTLLKLIFLETEHMTAYDLDVIEDWRQGFQRVREASTGCNPTSGSGSSISSAGATGASRMIQMVLGRRASKGFIGGDAGLLSRSRYLISLDNPQRHYGIRDGKDVFLNVGATNQTQAQRHQFADIRDVVESCQPGCSPTSPRPKTTRCGCAPQQTCARSPT